MRKFEYITFKERLHDFDLNQLGEQGWELVSHTAVPETSCQVFKQYYVFKRELTNKPIDTKG